MAIKYLLINFIEWTDPYSYTRNHSTTRHGLHTVRLRHWSKISVWDVKSFSVLKFKLNIQVFSLSPTICYLLELYGSGLWKPNKFFTLWIIERFFYFSLMDVDGEIFNVFNRLNWLISWWFLLIRIIKNWVESIYACQGICLKFA